MKRSLLTSCIALSVLTVAAHAADDGFYAGATVGVGSVKLSGDGAATTNSTTSFSLDGGYRLNRYLGAELAYRNFGKSTFANVVDVKAADVDASIVGTLPLTEDFSLTGRAGVGRFRLEADASDVGLGSATDNVTNGLVGVGAAYKLTSQWHLTGEYLYVPRKDGVTLSSFAVGAQYQF